MLGVSYGELFMLIASGAVLLGVADVSVTQSVSQEQHSQSRRSFRQRTSLTAL